MTQPQTSKDAYAAVKPKINSLHLKLMGVLRDEGPKTASELMDATGVIYNTVWRRLSELKSLGIVINTEDTRKNNRGRSETVVALA